MTIQLSGFLRIISLYLANGSAESRGVQLQQFYNDLPDVYDFTRIKEVITKLNSREVEFTGDSRLEYRRQLMDIRNLFRIVRAEVLDQKNQITPRLRIIHNNLLRKNWGKMKNSMITAESYL